MRPEDIAEVTALVKDSGTSFYYGMKVLPAPRRDAMYALYAFCRVVDDIADEPAPLAQKTAELNDWRGRVADLYRGRTSNGLTRALQSATRTYDLQQADYLAIIDGMEMDAGAPIVGPDLATLDLYCDRVASAVGRHSVRIFGDSGPAAQDVAYALGRALQLTNIVRDVGEDAHKGRLYLPREWLLEAGVPIDAAAALTAPGLPRVCQRVARLADQYYNEAAGSMALCQARAMRPARLMAASYRPLLNRLRAQNFDYAAPRVRLPKWRKLLLAARLLTG
jgi:squalene synthase HpnD